jgi:hypothetical protein
MEEDATLGPIHQRRKERQRQRRKDAETKAAAATTAWEEEKEQEKKEQYTKQASAEQQARLEAEYQARREAEERHAQEHTRREQQQSQEQVEREEEQQAKREAEQQQAQDQGRMEAERHTASRVATEQQLPVLQNRADASSHLQETGVTYHEVELQLTAIGEKVGLGLILSEQPDRTTGRPTIVVDGWKDNAMVVVTVRTTSVEPSDTAATAVSTRERWPIAAADAIRVGDVLVGLFGKDVRGLESEDLQLMLRQAARVRASESRALPTVALLLARGQAGPDTPGGEGGAFGHI